MKKRELFIDIDGCIANFCKSASELLGIDPDWATWNCPAGDKNMWRAIDKAGEDFWVNLEPLPYFKELTSITKDFILLTSPGRHPSCASGKTKWIQRHFGTNFRRYIICASDKSLCCRPGDILIDDSEKNIKDWNEAGGLGILWPHSGNSQHLSEEVLINLVKAKINDKVADK